MFHNIRGGVDGPRPEGLAVFQGASECKEVEDEDDWGSRGRELRLTIAGIVRIKAIDQSGQHCYNPRVAFPACFFPSPIVLVLVVVLVLGLWCPFRAAASSSVSIIGFIPLGLG